ncbi:unnamed protein product [Prorocentrum cordatum]|uniref:Uncharacterized protein n=1 Tax=Prorocentrum cordatum TaxID=2364126 RepID=A0ABN9UGW8_9DINO|nr:unnamed protein product [Polarella glacialis]
MLAIDRSLTPFPYPQGISGRGTNAGQVASQARLVIQKAVEGYVRYYFGTGGANRDERLTHATLDLDRGIIGWFPLFAAAYTAVGWTVAAADGTFARVAPLAVAVGNIPVGHYLAEARQGGGKGRQATST